MFYAKKGLSHDESVTYQCAAAKELSYLEKSTAYTDSVITVDQILDCYKNEPGLKFKKIASDLTVTDIHPPLYFWLLHIVYKIIGFHLFTGLLINLVCTCFILILTYKIARELLKDSNAALVACLFWLLSPAVVQIDLEARHYQLFGLLALTSVYLHYKLMYKTGNYYKTLSLIALVNMAGMLTHYYFLFIIACPFLTYLVSEGFSKKFWVYCAFGILSLVGFFLLFPDFFVFLKVFGRGSEESGFKLDVARMKPLIYSVLMYFTYWHSLKYIYMATFLILLAWFVKKPGLHFLRHNTPTRYFFVCLCWFCFFSAFLYVFSISPPHATGEQYFSYIWPLLSIFSVLGLKRRLKDKFYIPAFAHILFLAFALVFSVNNSPYVTEIVPQPWKTMIEHTELLATNNPGRGYLPRSLVNIDGKQRFLLMDDSTKYTQLLTRYRSVSLLLKNSASRHPILDTMLARKYSIKEYAGKEWNFYVLNK
jgi:hypothetical protein